MPDVKQILAESVTKLLDTRQDISRLNLSRLMGVADGTLGRIKYGSGNPNVETVEQIARFFKYDAWQLLVPGFDPIAPPALGSPANDRREQLPAAPAGGTTEEEELLSIFRRLKEPERTYLLLNARGYIAARPSVEELPAIKSPGAKVA